MNNTPSKIAASVVLMVVFLVDAVLYVWQVPENDWSYLALATVYAVSLLIAAGIVSVLNKP
jgi:ABC-type transport system involved in cytochrome c biogenesis permease subunit